MNTKRLNRRDFLKVAGIGGAGLVLAACVPAAPKPATTEAKPTEEKAPAEAAPAEAVTLEFWAPHPLQDNIKINEFLPTTFYVSNPNIKINFTQVPSEWEQKFRTAAAGGTLPDLFAVDGINVPAYTSRGLTAEIAGIDAAVLDDFFPSGRAEMEYEGKVYAAVLETNSQALRINMDMLEAAGAKVPTTWQELIEEGQKITLDVSGKKANEAGFDPNALKQAAFETWCCTGEGSTWMILSWIWSNGGDVYDANKNVTFADPPAVEAVQFLSDLIKKYYIWPKSGVMTAGPEGTFYGQLIAMGETGAFDLANLTVTNPPTFKWDVAKVPAKEAGGEFVSGVGGWLVSAYKDGKHIPEANEFQKFMMGDDWQLHTSKYGYALTGRKTIAEQRLAEVPQLQTFIDCMLAGRARPRSSEYPTITEAMYTAFDESIFGDRPPQESMSEAAKKIEDALAKEAAGG